ncbi:MAG: ribose-phosphate pyrophosphokinase [Verrucomicrobia subdivision 3 bacterium]|nr:ribose-phosphate pyrophosphokinase [Limisphaerales bacterium]
MRIRIPPFSLFAGTGNPDLAAAVARALDHPVSPCTVERFPDGEISVHLDEPVRGHPVFVLQSTSPPVTENLFQLLSLVDACRRAAAGRVTAVVPYFGYARSDKRHARREPIAASMVASLCQTVGLNHLVTLDLHAAQIEGFFHLPVDNLTAVPILCDELKHRLSPGTVVVSPDEGRVKMAGDFAQRLGADVAVVHKQRKSGTETKIIKVVGDVRDRPCLIIDDMISTGGTIERAIAALLKSGARPEIRVAATHGVLVEGTRSALSHPALGEIYVTDTVAPHHRDWPQLKVISVAPLLAAAIQRLAARESIGDLFQ